MLRRTDYLLTFSLWITSCKSDSDLKRYAQSVRQFADNAAPKNHHAGDEDGALDHQDPLAEWREIILQCNDEECANEGAENGAQSADKRHQHDLARHIPMHV